MSVSFATTKNFTPNNEKLHSEPDREGGSAAQYTAIGRPCLSTTYSIACRTARSLQSHRVLPWADQYLRRGPGPFNLRLAWDFTAVRILSGGMSASTRTWTWAVRTCAASNVHLANAQASCIADSTVALCSSLRLYGGCFIWSRSYCMRLESGSRTRWPGTLWKRSTEPLLSPCRRTP